MHKKFMLIAVGILSSFQVINSRPVMALKLAPGVFTADLEDARYIVNEKTDFTITRIIPSENMIYAVYNNRSGMGENKLRVVNFQYGDFADWQLASLYGANPYISTSIYNFATSLPGYAKFEEGEEDMIFSAVELRDADLSKIVYSVRYSFSADIWLAGRVDISRCVNALEYRDGMECRAEDNGTDVWEYQLYDGDEKINMTWAKDDITEEDNNESKKDDKEDESDEVEHGSIDMESTLPIVQPTLMTSYEAEEGMPEIVGNGFSAIAYDGGIYNREATPAADPSDVNSNTDEVNIPELGSVCQYEREWGWIPGLILLILSMISWCASFKYQYKLRKELKKSRVIEK